MEPTEHPAEQTTSEPPISMHKPMRRRKGHDGEHLEERLRSLRDALRAARQGDFTVRLPTDAAENAMMEEVSFAFNALVEENDRMIQELDRVARTVVVEGDITVRATLGPVSGSWASAVESVNTLVETVAWTTVETRRVVSACASGDLSQTMSPRPNSALAQGEFARLESTVNGVVGRLRAVSSEISRVVREVGVEGKLGVQASVEDLSGTWKDVTDNVNLMASNLTGQVRGIIKVVTALAMGDLCQKFAVEAHGEMAALADAINVMTERLRTFAEQVSTLAREVGIDGQLGGRATVPGAAGMWRDLTDDVNLLAASLTAQIRAISEAATAASHGDLNRTITVETRGEVLALKDAINRVIANLRDTTRRNMEHDWLETNLAKFFRVMHGQRDLQSLADQIMSELTPVVGAQHGAFYLAESEDGDKTTLTLRSTYAYSNRKHLSNRFELGEGLVGQCARERKAIIVTDVPADYVRIASGLGESPPRSIAVYPVFFEKQVRGVIELGSFHEFSSIQLAFLEQLMLSIGPAMNLIDTTTRAEQLVRQLQGSKLDLEMRRKELEHRAQLLESRERAIAQASASLESKSQEVPRVSHYTSPLLMKMADQIRTRLSSIMNVAQMLAANEDKTLAPKQQEWATTIHSAEGDLLALVTQTLDLAEAEAAGIEPHFEAYPLSELWDFVVRTFRPMALQKGLTFSIEVGEGTPDTVVTDSQLLAQILENLLANAFKFTERGRVDLRIEHAIPGLPQRTPSIRVEGPSLGLGGVYPWRPGRTPSSSRCAPVLAFVVSDTGLGIAPEQQAKLFEAFQQADLSISRKYGGIGLGLTISQEYARVLGGEISLESTLGAGSTFTLYLPLEPAPITATGSPDLGPLETIRAATSVGPEETTELAGKKVLVIEDDARDLYALTALLERHGMTVIPVANAGEAFAALDRHPGADIVLMAVTIPEIDGYRATQTLRAKPAFSQSPIIALTAKASDADRARVRAAGCTTLVAKPVETRQLLSVMIRTLRAEGSDGDSV
jgi:signal transduction histidine kinase/CheY-like chemotaxis protein/methyl-accepting chemotaxis protein